MLFNLESNATLLHHHTKGDIECFGFCSGNIIILAVNSILGVVSILHIRTGKFLIQILIDAVVYKILVKLIDRPEFTCKINHRTGFALLVHHKQRRNACSLCHKGIIGTESRRNVYNTCTILCCNIVSGNHTESIG